LPSIDFGCGSQADVSLAHPLLTAMSAEAFCGNGLGCCRTQPDHPKSNGPMHDTRNDSERVSGCEETVLRLKVAALRAARRGSSEAEQRTHQELRTGGSAGRVPDALPEH